MFITIIHLTTSIHIPSYQCSNTYTLICLDTFYTYTTPTLAHISLLRNGFYSISKDLQTFQGRRGLNKQNKIVQHSDIYPTFVLCKQ